MNRLKIFMAAALLVAISGIASAEPSGPIGNPEIYGEWKFDLTVDAGTLGDEECVFTGDLELRITAPIKEAANKLSDPVFGDAVMELVSGDCGDFVGEIFDGSASGNSVFMAMEVFPISTIKAADKGDPLILVLMLGELIDDTLMEGIVTSATIIPNPKGIGVGSWRTTRSSMVPALTPLGILALLAGLGLVGGIALRRRK